MKTFVALFFLVCQTGLALPQASKFSFPGESWQQYTSVEEAGYSAARLDSARAYFEKSEAAGLFAVHRGRVLVAWGETSRRFICASVRKSFLSALIGIATAEGKLDLNKTLRDLQIDDISGLSETEKQATVKNLLTARSGVYHPAAYSPRNMIANLPVRDSHKPGEFWYYNNWDFNTLGAIFEQETGQGVFEAFDKRIATPLQMEDFQLSHTYYRYEKDKSKYPAYLFRMSARDMARFGLLYLSNGVWRNRQIIPSNWVSESTRPISEKTGGHANLGAYGYLWWISQPILGEEMYFASGSGGQKIAVLPEAELVLVHVVNTYQNDNVGHEQFKKLVEQILSARVAKAVETPRLAVFNPPAAHDYPEPLADIDGQTLQQYEGTFQHRFLGQFKITSQGEHLVMESGIGIFDLTPIAEDTFWPPDIEIPIVFKRTESPDKKLQVDSDFDQNRKIIRIVFNY